ncbi:MAG: hypothetical protein IJ485_05345 [Lachnospiraceae bacterium]|nr:hypothetical protein [Lachnospiraceae bacterium]
MNKEEVVSTFVMCVVSVLMLIGFTIAWYSGAMAHAAVLGMDMLADDMQNIIIALESGGEDVAILAEQGEYADVGLDELDNIQPGEMAPGAFGEVTFYITPLEDEISVCDILPAICIRQGSDEWYSGENNVAIDEDAEADAGEGGETVTIEKLYDIAQNHIAFFTDEQMQNEITEDNPLQLTWAESERMVEKPVTVYWKWHYEYPFTAEEDSTMTSEAKETAIDEYD